MLAPYRRVLARPGATPFFLTGLVARAPMAMIGLGIVLLVSAQQGSYAVAGTVSAAFVLAEGALALVQGRLLDRFGQARVLVPATLVSNLTLVALVAAVQADAPVLLLVVTSALAGATFPLVGSCVRSRWSWMLRDDPAAKDTAFALEGVADESAFVLGPVLVTVLATQVHPTAGLLAAALVAVVGTLAFARERGTEPPVGQVEGGPVRASRLGWDLLLPTAVVAVGLGALFGGTEVATVAFADELGDRSASGVLLAIWAIGSLVAGAVTGTLTWRVDAATRLRRFSAAFALLVLPLPFVGSILGMGAALLVVGVTVAPTLIALVATIEHGAADGRLTESLAVVHTGLAVGVAAGAAGAGHVVDTAGASSAYVVPVVAIVLAAAAAQLTRPRRVAVPDGAVSLT